MPIKIEPTPLEDSARDKLQTWLKDARCKIFVSVVEAKVKTAQIAALERVMKDDEAEGKMSASEIKEAKKYQACLDVLNEISESQELTTVTLK